MSKNKPHLSSEEALALNLSSAEALNRALAVRDIPFRIEKRGEEGWYSFEDLLHAITTLVEDLVDESSNPKKLKIVRTTIQSSL